MPEMVACRVTALLLLFLLQEEVQPDIQQEKVYLQGQDRHGRGVCVLQGRKHTFTTHTSQQRFITYVIDGMIAACDRKVNPEARIVAVFELQSESTMPQQAVAVPVGRISTACCRGLGRLGTAASSSCRTTHAGLHAWQKYL
jgi:hypothetical protein